MTGKKRTLVAVWIGMLMLVMGLALITGCGTNKSSAKVRVMALKGPTAMGMVKMMEDAEGTSGEGNGNEFTIAASVDEVTPKLVQGEVDLAAVPANLASVIYHKTEGEIQVLAVNTLGVLYLVQTGDEIQSVDDLKGKTIYASGKGATPEYALRYILEQNGIDMDKEVQVEWKSEHAECVAAVTGKENGVALLPQPFVTTAMKQNPNIKLAVDLNQEWDKVQEGAPELSALVTGVLVGRTSFIKENKEAVSAFLEEYNLSVEYVNENIEDAAALIEKFGIVPAAVAKDAIPYCNIVCIGGSEGKQMLSGYLQVLMEQNPDAVGGALPSDDFYYEK